MLQASLPLGRAGGVTTALACAALLTLRPAAQAGHEVNYYPSFYPQEIRIEPLDPVIAAKELNNNTLHAYIGAEARFSGGIPAHLKSVVSLRSLITVRTDPQRMSDRDARCVAHGQAAAALAKEPDVIVHHYPITPYHADYLGHVDRVPQPKKRPAGGVILAASHIAFEEIEIDTLLNAGGVWPAPPWAKEGWFQAYHLLRSAVSEAAAGTRADALYEKLTHGEFSDLAERINLERALVAALTNGCERSVIAYRLRREFYNDDFSGGVENILVDSHSGLNSPVLLRTIKLKDFPWNGWLRVGIGMQPQAAWNPVAGFTDAAGRLVWSIVGDNAFLPIPYNSRWVPNRVEIRDDDDAKQSIRIPADAVVPQPGSGQLGPVGAGRGAMGKVTYRVLASSFHDGTEMEPADFLYPYALAFRWGGGDPNGTAFDPDIAAATRLMRERLKGVRIVRVEENTLTLADLTFTYRSPIVEIYLDTLAADEHENALFAPPWSTVPWHVLALMEAAVERGIGAFSQSEARRRGLPWLDLVRDAEQRMKLVALVKEFAATNYRPAVLEELVGPDQAGARWRALEKFVETSNHLLVTNGPYRLASATPEAFVLEVIREFTYPIGIGTFDPHAYPPRASITTVERAGNRMLVAADVEVAVKQQRDRRMVRTPLKRDSMRGIFPIRPVARYVIVGGDRKVVAAGNARWEEDGRFAAPLQALTPGAYSFFIALFPDGNTIDPTVGRIDFRKE